MSLMSLAAVLVTDDDLRFVRRVIRDLLPDARVRAFGSRVRGEPHEDSDLDLAIDHGRPIPLSILAELDDTFAESPLPFTVDIVDWQRIDDDFREHIQLRCVTI